VVVTFNGCKAPQLRLWRVVEAARLRAHEKARLHERQHTSKWGDMMELEELHGRIQGDVTKFGDAGYETLRRTMVWNQLVPERHPRIIVEAANDNDVIEAVRFARANRMKIAVRGGGHSWVGFSLRDDSLLIDLGCLNEVSIDPQARRAIVGPP
jgi:hypothetical protein